MKDDEKKVHRRRRRGGSSIVTKESVSAVFAVFSLLAFVILCTNELLFGAIGGAVHGFLTGVFGYFAYPVMLAIFYLSFMGLIGKRLVRNRKAGTCITLTLIFVALIVHTATTFTWNLDGYLERCFQAPTLLKKPFITVAGWFGGLPVWGLSKLITKVGTLIVLSLFALLFGYLSYVAICGNKKKEKVKQPKEKKGEDNRPVEIPLTQTPTRQVVQPVNPTPSQPNAVAQYTQPTSPTSYGGYTTVDTAQQPGVVLNGQKAGSGRAFSPFAGGEQVPTDMDERRKFLFGKSAQDRYKDNLIFDPNARVNTRPQETPYNQPTPVSYTDAYQTSVNQQPTRPEKIVTDFSTPYNAPLEREIAPTTPRPVDVPTQPVMPTFERERREEQPTPIMPREEERREDFRFTVERTSATDRMVDSTDREDRNTDRAFESRERKTSRLDIFDEEDDPYTLRDDFSDNERGRDGFSRREEEETRRETRDFSRDTGTLFSDRGNDFLSRDREERTLETSRVQAIPTPPPEPPKPRIIRPYVQPRIDDFTCTDVQPTHNPEEEASIKNTIVHTLEDYKVTGATIVSTTHGPTVTRYNVAITRDTPPQKVLALESPLAMSLQSSLVSVAPNYDSGTISIEVPNKNRQFVNLGSMLTGDTFVNAKSSSLMFTMGKDVSNAKVYGDLSKMVHLLVAGGTGGGKSVFLGAMIMSLIYKYSPEELRLILIDPKKTEFSLYYNLPHLMINEIITDSKKTVRALNWAEGEMNRRYDLISQMTKSGKFVQNIDQYNGYVEKENKLPKIVIIIDELADLMLTSDRKDIEDRIQSLTQKARAAGIHVVVATQRPSTNVITGVIKTNLTTRIAFSVPTDVDSRVILDHTGAQNLCGLGDMLYFISGMKSPVRVQSPFISNEEAQTIVNFIKDNNEAYYDEEATAYINDSRGGTESDIDDNDGFDPVYVQALRYVIMSNTASISLVQRKCSVGYNKAGKIIDWMDNKGYITPFDGAKARKVLITKEQFEELYGPF